MEINQTKVIRARILLAYLEAYHPKEHALFIAALGDILQSFEDEQFVDAVLRHVEGFLLAHPEDQERLQSVSPREVVEEVGQQLVEDAKKRRGDIRLRAKEIVNKYVRGTTTEKQAFEDELVASINASISRAETPQQLRVAIEEEVAALPVPAKEIVQQFVDADPLSAQRLLLTNSARDSVVVEHVANLPAPAWRGYIAAVENLQMGPNETVDEHVSSAKDVGLVEAFLSSDLSQTPAARAGPGALVTTILEASDNKEALKVFEKLSEQAKNAASFLVIANAWEKTVDVITRRAGGALAQGLEPIIREAKKQTTSGSIKQVASLVSDVINPILGRTFERLTELEMLSLASPDKTKAIVSSPQTLLLLAVYTWRAGDLQFELQQAQGGGGLGAWAVHITKDSVLEKLFSKFVKSKTVEAAGGVVKKGGSSLVAGLLTKLGLSATADVVLAMIGTPVATAIKWAIQGAIWFGGYIWRPISNFLGKLTRGEIAQLGAAQSAIKQTLDSWLGPRPPAQPKKWYEQDWVVIALAVGAAVFLPMLGAMHLFTTRDSALFMAGQENQPEEFQDFDQTYPPPDYIDFSTLASKGFDCLSFGEGIYAGPGPSARLEEKEVNRIINTINNYPQLKALSCGLGCPDKKITITKFTNASSYGGFAPSARPGNVILYQHTFTRYGDQTFAYLLAHELAHNIDWFNGPIATGFESLGCSGVPSTYKFSGNPSESFAESVALYLIGHPEARSYCGGRAFSYLNQELSQCR